MGSVNPTIELARVTSDIDLVQMQIADEQVRMDNLISGNTDEAVEEQMAAIRVFITELKASLGALRSEEAFWRQELQEEKNARKNQNDLARG